MLISPRVTRYDLSIEQVRNLHSRVGIVCLSGLSQPAFILFQLLQTTLEIEKRVVISGLLRAILHHLVQGSVRLSQLDVISVTYAMQTALYVRQLTGLTPRTAQI